MAAGNTIAGEVRARARRVDGSEPRLFGPLNQNRVDYHNNTVDAAEELYINTALSDLRSKPAGAESIQVPNAILQPGEQLIVEHRSSSLEEAANVGDGDAFAIDIVVQDLNQGVAFPTTLTEPDNELSSNVTTSTSSWVSFFEDTVPDRQRWFVAGSFQAIATEAA